MAAAFQIDAFQNNAFQVGVVQTGDAFQCNAFQNSAFQTPDCTPPAPEVDPFDSYFRGFRLSRSRAYAAG